MACLLVTYRALEGLFIPLPVQAAAAEKQEQLESTLQATTDLLTKTMEAATLKDAELQAQKAEHSKQVEALQARLQEAAGALNAKDELREARYVGWYAIPVFGLPA
jgi:hypothetical protein